MESEDAPLGVRLPSRNDRRLRDDLRVRVLKATVEHQALGHPRAETVVVETAVRVLAEPRRVIAPDARASRTHGT